MSSISPRLEQVIDTYITRELVSEGPLLRPGVPTQLLRRSSSSVAMSVSYKTLCFLDLAAGHLLRSEPFAPFLPSVTVVAFATAASPTSSADAAHRSKCQMLEGARHPIWLRNLLAFDWQGSTPDAGCTDVRSHSQWPMGTPGWCRRLLLFATVLRRAALLPDASQVEVVSRILPMALRGVEEAERELQLCALAALLAIVPSHRETSLASLDARASMVGSTSRGPAGLWSYVWEQLWAIERPSWESDPAAAAADLGQHSRTAIPAAASPTTGLTGHVCELRQRVLAQLLFAGAVPAKVASRAAADVATGCARAAALSALPRQALACCLLASLPQGAEGVSAAALYSCVVAAPYCESPSLLSDRSMLLHPAAIACCEREDSTRAVARSWVASRLSVALSVVAATPELMRWSNVVSPLLSPLASAAATSAALPRTGPTRAATDLLCVRLLDIQTGALVSVGASGAHDCERCSLGAEAFANPVRAASFVDELACVAPIDSDSRMAAQAEVELLQLDAISAEARRYMEPPTRLPAIWSIGAGAVPSLVGGIKLDACLREQTSSALTALCAALAKALSERPQPPLLLAQRLSLGASLLTHPTKEVTLCALSATSAASPPISPSVMLGKQLVRSVTELCDGVCHSSDERTLVLLPLLASLVHALRLVPLAPAAAADGAAARAAVAALGVIARVVQEQAATLLRQQIDIGAGERSRRPELDDGCEAGIRICGVSGASTGCNALMLGWLTVHETLGATRLGCGVSSAHAGHLELRALSDLIRTTLSCTEDRAAISVEVCASLCGVGMSDVRKGILIGLGGAVAGSRLHAARVLRIAIELSTRLMRSAASASEALIGDAASPGADRGCVRGVRSVELQAETLRGAAPLLVAAMAGWEDAPIDDATTTALAALSFLQLVTTAPAEVAPAAPSARVVVNGLLGLLQLQRSTDHGDLLRIQASLLPLLPRLFELVPASELIPILRDASRSCDPWPTRPGDWAAARHPTVSTVLAAALTGTAALCCAYAAPALLFELVVTSQVAATPTPPQSSPPQPQPPSTPPAPPPARACLPPRPPRPPRSDSRQCPQVDVFGDTALLALLRARSAHSGSLPVLLQASLPWLIGAWLDSGHELITFPYHWLMTELDVKADRKNSYAAFLRQHVPSGVELDQRPRPAHPTSSFAQLRTPSLHRQDVAPIRPGSGGRTVALGALCHRRACRRRARSRCGSSHHVGARAYALCPCRDHWPLAASPRRKRGGGPQVGAARATDRDKASGVLPSIGLGQTPHNPRTTTA